MELARDELELVIQTLVYDGRLEEVHNSVLAIAGRAAVAKAVGTGIGGSTMYKVSKATKLTNHYTSMPCGMCPLVSQCCEGGVISPSTCEYMTHWLSVSQADVALGDW